MDTQIKFVSILEGNAVTTIVEPKKVWRKVRPSTVRPAWLEPTTEHTVGTVLSFSSVL